MSSPRGTEKSTRSSTRDRLIEIASQVSDKTYWPNQQDSSERSRAPKAAEQDNTPRTRNVDRIVRPTDSLTVPTSRNARPKPKQSARDNGTEYIYTERIVMPADRPRGWRPSDDGPSTERVEYEEFLETRRPVEDAPPNDSRGQRREERQRERNGATRQDGEYFRKRERARSPAARLVTPTGRSPERRPFDGDPQVEHDGLSETSPPIGDALSKGIREGIQRESDRARQRAERMADYIVDKSKESLNERREARQERDLEKKLEKERKKEDNLELAGEFGERSAKDLCHRDIRDSEESNHVRFNKKVDISPTPPGSDASSSAFRSFHSFGRGNGRQIDGQEDSKLGEHTFARDERRGRMRSRVSRKQSNYERGSLQEGRKMKDNSVSYSNKWVPGGRPLERALSESPSREEWMPEYRQGKSDGRGPYRIQERPTESMRVEDGSPDDRSLPVRGSLASGHLADSGQGLEESHRHW